MGKVYPPSQISLEFNRQIEVMVVQNSAKKWRTQDLKVSCNYIKILSKYFVGRIFKRNKISNEDILRLKSQ